jgi:hypothetical protein
MNAEPRMSNSQSLAKLAEQGIFVAPVLNKKSGLLFLVDDDTNENIGCVGKSLTAEVTALLEQAERTKKPVSMPQDWVVSDMETDSGDTIKCLHKAGNIAPRLVSSRPASTTKQATARKF